MEFSNDKLAELFNTDADNISSYVAKKTSNLKYVKELNFEEDDYFWTLMQEVFVKVRLKTVKWDNKIRGAGTSSMECRIWINVPYVE